MRWSSHQSWQHAVRAARRKYHRIPLWIWARAGHEESGHERDTPVTAQEAGRVAFGVLLDLAERARAAEASVRRNRDLPGWDGCLDGARRSWPEVADDVWVAIGELPAPEGTHFVASANELAVEAGLLGLDDPGWSRSTSR